MKWEYWAIHLWQSGANTEHKNADLLNKQGQDEWELVSVDNGVAYFKRPIEEQPKKIPPDDTGYTYETVQDGYVIFGPNGRKMPEWDVVSLLNQFFESRKRND